jgi:branched-chain amino acid transport system substrate-binding protein
MKTKWNRCVFLLLVLFTLSIFTSGTVFAKTVKIGLIAPFSGGYARWGEQFQQAIEVFQSDYGDNVNGNKVEVIYRDIGGIDPAKSKRFAEELILREKVKFLAGFAFTPNGAAVASVVNEAKIPTVLMNAATSKVIRMSEYFVRISFTLTQDTVPLAAWCPKNGITKVITMVAEYGPGFDGEGAFVKVFKENGGEILESIRVPMATTDFAPFFERVLERKPQAMFMFGPGGAASVGMINTWAARLKPAGIELLVTNETQEIDLPKFGPAAIGVVGCSHYTEVNDNPMNIKLRQKLEAMFGPKTIPDTATVSAYDGMRLIYMALEKFGPNVTGDQAIKLWRGQKLESARGPILIDAKTRDIVQNVYLRRVVERDGRLVNKDFHTTPMVKDPWPEWYPEK